MCCICSSQVPETPGAKPRVVGAALCVIAPAPPALHLNGNPSLLGEAVSMQGREKEVLYLPLHYYCWFPKHAQPLSAGSMPFCLCRDWAGGLVLWKWPCVAWEVGSL